MFKNKALLPIFVVVFVDLLGCSIILPLMPFYAQDYGASPALIGLFVASYSIFQFISSPILGAMSDKYGRRPLLIYSQIGSMIGFILLGIGGSMIVLFISRIIDGISGGNLTIAHAYIADVTEPHERASSLALIGIAFGLGFMMGPFIGGELSTLFGRSAPAYCAAAMALASTLLTFFYLKEPPHRPQEHAKSGLGYYLRSLEYFKEITLRELLLIFFFFSFPFTLYVSMFSLYAHIELNFNEAEVGRFLAYVGFLGIIWQGGVIRVLVKKVSELSLLRTGLAAMMIGLLLIVIGSIGLFIRYKYHTAHTLVSVDKSGTARAQRRRTRCGIIDRKFYTDHCADHRRTDHRQSASQLYRICRLCSCSGWRILGNEGTNASGCGFDQCNGISSDGFVIADSIHSLICCCLDRNFLYVDTKCIGNVFSHRVNMLTEFWFFENNGRIYIDDRTGFGSNFLAD